MSKDITYCTCGEDCPYTDCERHLTNFLESEEVGSFAQLYRTCKRYIAHLLNIPEEDRFNDNQRI